MLGVSEAVLIMPVFQHTQQNAISRTAILKVRIHDIFLHMVLILGLLEDPAPQRLSTSLRRSPKFLTPRFYKRAGRLRS